MVLTQAVKNLRSLLRRKKRAILIGAGPVEYVLLRRLQREQEYEVLFLIDEDPWNHRTRICGAELRYPVEIDSLCSNYRIEEVIYCDEDKLRALPNLRRAAVHIES